MTPEILALLVEAAGVTAALGAVSIGAGLLLGFAVSAALLSRRRALRGPARLFVSFFRGVPLLVQLLLIYNVLPAVGVVLPGIAAAALGLTLCTAAYQAENLRGGFLAVPPGLVEAAEVAGMSVLQRFWRVRAPIAFKLTLPALVGEAIMILKASSLVSVVGVVELTRTAQDIAASTYRPLPVYAAAGALYVAVDWTLAGAGAALERRLRWGAA